MLHSLAVFVVEVIQRGATMILPEERHETNHQIVSPSQIKKLNSDWLMIPPDV